MFSIHISVLVRAGGEYFNVYAINDSNNAS